jgi:hypothetical protein
MSRIAGQDVIVIKPQNNVYTVMVIVATVVQLLTLAVVILRFKSVFGAFIFQS